MKKILVLAIFIISLIGIGSLGALEWTYWSLDAGVTYQINAQIGEEPQGKYPSILMFNPGAGFFLDFDGARGGGYIRPSFWFSWGVEDVYKGIARPSEEANITHMKILGLMLDSPFGYSFVLSRGVELGLHGGLAFYLRFPLYKASLGTGNPADFWAAYYSQGEFLYLSTGAWISFSVAEKTELQISLRYYQPFSTLWTSAPFLHGIQASLAFSLRYPSPAFKSSK